MLKCLCAVIAAAGLAVNAQGAFVGGGVVSLQSWNDAANASGLADLAGGPVRVYRIYAAFSGQSPNEDTLFAVTRINTTIDRPVVNVASGVPSGDVFQNPATVWDSFVTINVESLAGDAIAPGFYDGDPWSGNALTGGWFVYEDLSQGLAGTRAGSDDFGTGNFLVMIAQVTVRDDGLRSGDVIDFRSDGFFGGAGVFSGTLKMAVNLQAQTEVDSAFVVPAPGAIFMAPAFVIGAGLRRRRETPRSRLHR